MAPIRLARTLDEAAALAVQNVTGHLPTVSSSPMAPALRRLSPGNEWP